MSAEDRWDGMPEAYPPPLPSGPAVEAYAEAFGADALPYLRQGGEGEAEARLLRLAVRRGRLLRGWTVERLTGGWRRMPGPEVVL